MPMATKPAQCPGNYATQLKSLTDEFIYFHYLGLEMYRHRQGQL